MLYALGALTGLALGVLYGLNGWRGSVKENPLQKSARVKNLFWVLGAGGVAVLGDIHKISDTADKALLAVSYYVFLAIGGFGTITVLAVITMLNTRGRWEEYTAGDALLDYLEFGYDYVRRRGSEHSAELRKAQRQADEWKHYLRQLTACIASAGSEGAMDHRIEIARQVLDAVTAIVLSLNPELKTVRTNFMRVVDCTNDNRGTLLFTERPETVSRCLELAIYDSGVVPANFSLPLVDRPGAHQHVLPGAPAALAYSKAVVVDDTRDLEIAKEIPEAVRKQIKEYFKLQEFRSFASLPVVAGGRPVGVLNVESTEIEVFGSTIEQQNAISLRMFPFCAALGILLKE